MTGEAAAAGRARVESLLELRRWDDATRLVAQLLASAPDDTELLLLLARAHLGAQRNDDALAAADAAIGSAPANPRAHYWRTLVLLRLGRPASDSARQAVELAPHNPYAWLLMTRAHMEASRWIDARESAQRTLELSGALPVGHHALGLMHLRRREWVLAEMEYRSALALDPTNPDYLNNLGLALLHQGDAKSAVQQFVSAGELAPGDSDLYRRNAASAGEAYVQRPHATLRRRGGAGILVGAMFFLIFIALASSGVGLAITVGFIVGLIGTAVFLDRFRMRRLPLAARLAVQSGRRERRAHWRVPSRWTARQWWRVCSLTILVVIAVLLGLASRKPVPVLGPRESPVCAAAREGLVFNNDGTTATPAQLGCPRP